MSVVVRAQTRPARLLGRELRGPPCGPPTLSATALDSETETHVASSNVPAPEYRLEFCGSPLAGSNSSDRGKREPERARTKWASAPVVALTPAEKADMALGGTEAARGEVEAERRSERRGTESAEMREWRGEV